MSTMMEAENEADLHADLEPQRRRFTVDEFQRMGEAGIFAPDERVELIDGEVLRMTPIGTRHVEAVLATEDALRELAGPKLRVVSQNTIELIGAQLFPDLAVYDREKLRTGVHLSHIQCVLIVEVSDTTIRMDRGPKRRNYAASGIPEYWVVNLPANKVAVHREPASGDYASVVEYGRGSAFVSPALGGATVRVDDLFKSPFSD